MVSDTDGSAFITKAEFDSLKNNFQAQIDSYNASIDSKIDGAIAQYLSGLNVSRSEILANIWVKNEIEGFTGGEAKFITKPTTAFVQPRIGVYSFGGVVIHRVAALFAGSISTDALTSSFKYMINHGTNVSSAANNVPFLEYAEVDGIKYLSGLCKYDCQSGYSNGIRIDIGQYGESSSDGILYDCSWDWRYEPDMKCVSSKITMNYWDKGYSREVSYEVGPYYAKCEPVRKAMITDYKNCFFIGNASSSDNKYPIISNDGRLLISGFAVVDGEFVNILDSL